MAIHGIMAPKADLDVIGAFSSITDEHKPVPAIEGAPQQALLVLWELLEAQVQGLQQPLLREYTQQALDGISQGSLSFKQLQGELGASSLALLPCHPSLAPAGPPGFTPSVPVLQGGRWRRSRSCSSGARRVVRTAFCSLSRPGHGRHLAALWKCPPTVSSQMTCQPS